MNLCCSPAILYQAVVTRRGTHEMRGHMHAHIGTRNVTEK
eukprot:SAG31_NODE_3538_length_4145_cov_1.703658_5_plen_40_part_00